MKLKTIKIIVESEAEVKQRWAKALKGKIKKTSNEEVISVGSWETLGKIFTGSRLQILATVLSKKPSSILELAKLLDKDFKNVHADVSFLSNLGLIELKSVKNSRRIAPIAKYSDIELPLSA